MARWAEVRRFCSWHTAADAHRVAGDDQKTGETDRDFVDISDAKPLDVIFGKCIGIGRRENANTHRDVRRLIFGQADLILNCLCTLVTDTFG